MKTVYSLFENSVTLFYHFFIEMAYTKERILSKQALLNKLPIPIYNENQNNTSGHYYKQI